MANSGWDQVGPTGFSKVTGSFLTGNRSVLVSLGSGSHGPGGGCAPDAPLGAGEGRGVRGAVGGRGQQREPVVLEVGGGAGSLAPPRFRAPLPPLPLSRLPSPPRGEEGGGAEPSPGTGGVRVPSAPLPPAGLSWLPEAGVSRKSSERGRTTERTETSSSPSEQP